MYVVRVTAQDKRNLPSMMLIAIGQRQKLGALDGLIHVKDDVIQKIKYGWSMVSHWDTSEKDNDPPCYAK